MDMFHEVHIRYFPKSEALKSDNVIARHVNDDKIVFFGVDTTIPDEMVDALIKEVFPLIEERTGEISKEIISSDYLKRQMDGFDDHCRLMNALDNR